MVIYVTVGSEQCVYRIKLPTAERNGPSKIDQSEVSWVIRSARQLVEPPNPKKPTALRGTAGVWNRKSGNHIRGCDGPCIHAVNSLAGADG